MPRSTLVTTCLVLLTLMGAVFFLQYAQSILLPFIVSLLIYYALDPIVSRLDRVGIPRFAGSLVLIAALLVGGTYAASLLRGQAQELITRLPEALSKASAAIESYRGNQPSTVAKVQEAAGKLEKSATAVTGDKPAPGVTRVKIEEPLFDIRDYLWSGSLGMLWLIGQSITVVFLVFFLLASGDLYKRKLIEVVGPRLSHQKLTIQILNDVDQQIGRFLLVQVATSVVIGAAMGITLWMLGVNQAAMWGVLAGVLNSIPFFGTIIVTGALSLVAFLQFDTLRMVLTVACATLLVTSIDGFLLTPVLAGKVSKMNNVAVFLSLLFWGWLWGGLGMFLAIPIMMVVKSICDRIEELRPIGHLLAEAKSRSIEHVSQPNGDA